VFVVVIGFSALWAIVTAIQTLCSWNTKAKQENRALVLLRDDLQKAGPYKKDRSGIPEHESIIKMHAVIFKHAQKKIIEKELDY